MLKSVRPYISLDVESTGLHPQNGHELLSIGMVFDDGRADTKIEDMPKIHVGIKPGGDLVGSPYALAMNSKLIGILSGYDKESIEGMKILGNKEALQAIVTFIQNATEYVVKFDEANKLRPEPIQILAKNGSSLDIPMMNYHFSTYVEELNLDWFSRMISHRVMDLGSMYAPMYGRNPSLSLINKELKREPVSHNALEDAIDNVVAYRHIIKVSQ
jgi:hypothetical protein